MVVSHSCSGFISPRPLYAGWRGRDGTLSPASPAPARAGYRLTTLATFDKRIFFQQARSFSPSVQIRRYSPPVINSYPADSQYPHRGYAREQSVQTVLFGIGVDIKLPLAAVLFFVFSSLTSAFTQRVTVCSSERWLPSASADR